MSAPDIVRDAELAVVRAELQRAVGILDRLEYFLSGPRQGEDKLVLQVLGLPEQALTRVAQAINQHLINKHGFE